LLEPGQLRDSTKDSECPSKLDSAEWMSRGLRCRRGTRTATGAAGGGKGTDAGEGGSAGQEGRSEALSDWAWARAKESSCGSKGGTRDDAMVVALRFWGQVRALGTDEDVELLRGLATYM